jgi:hypothetical protein
MIYQPELTQKDITNDLQQMIISLKQYSSPIGTETKEIPRRYNTGPGTREAKWPQFVVGILRNGTIIPLSKSAIMN